MLLSFLLSFCSFTYQFLLVSLVALHSGLITESHALVLAFFLAGMGIGAARADIIDIGLARQRLLQNELWLILLMPLGYLAVQACTILIQKNALSMYWLLVLGQMVSSLVGYLTGRELPLLLKIHREHSSSKIISSNYFGALLSALFTTSAFVLKNGPVFVMSVAVLFTMTSALALIKRQQVIKTVLFIIASFGILLANQASQTPIKKLYYFFKKQTEYASGIVDAYQKAERSILVQSFISPYQEIDVVWHNQISLPESGSAGSVIRKVKTSLYLDRARQLTSGSEAVYHELMAFVPINATDLQPERALILGGGDGVLAATLFEKFPSVELTVVELDAEVLRLSKELRFIRRMNQNVFDSPNLNLIVDDAFAYVRRNRNLLLYDAVYLDFPFPKSDDHLRLYSVEFYRMVFNLLKPNGVVVLDFPIGGNKQKNKGIITTLHAAGAETVMAYGELATFLAARKQGGFDLNEAKLRRNLSELTLGYFKVKTVTKEEELQKKVKPNSIFRPNWSLRQ